MLLCLFLNFSQPGDENIEVHVDQNQGDYVVDGGGSVDASASVAVDCADLLYLKNPMMLFPLVGMKILILALKSRWRMSSLLLVLLLPLFVWRPTMFLKYREWSLM